MDRCIHDMPAGTCGYCDAERRPAVPICRWCPQPLTDPVSRQLGTGPKCFANENRLPDEIRQGIAESKNGAVSYGPLPARSANNWYTAFNGIDGVRAQKRTTAAGEVMIYLTAADDGRRVRRRPNPRASASVPTVDRSSDDGR